MAFAETDQIDVIRFAGYPTYSYYGWVFEADYATLTERLANMDPNEQLVITNTLLPNLRLLEQDIINCRNNLTASIAGPYTHNKNEVADRTSLFNDKRRELCAFIGCRPGAGLRMGGSVIRT